jgi:hypothetical protein
MQRMDEVMRRKRITIGGILLGIGLGEFFDGIVLHQILQWHHMVSHVDDYPTTTIAGLEATPSATACLTLPIGSPRSPPFGCSGPRSNRSTGRTPPAQHVRARRSRRRTCSPRWPSATPYRPRILLPHSGKAGSRPANGW